MKLQINNNTSYTEAIWMVLELKSKQPAKYGGQRAHNHQSPTCLSWDWTDGDVHASFSHHSKAMEVHIV